uniref:NADH-ubiquinone oxidoreductase chain 2 n=1 Tax=Pseudocleopatra dartevellei TaxID=2650574 RepID=A0A5J6E381_9CAEN|nr:NADH dehydrogenase subunit 2 [Pseudocleopatra dartevellei]QEU52728.1 NADH dehydrogenase subunit 2 [Pseudocleopatra dartevellei]
MFSSLPFSFMFFTIMVAGTVFSLSSSHWLGIWAGLEVNLIGFLPVLVYQKEMLESESAVKYFIVQALGSSFLIFGSLFSYSLSFSWEFLNQGILGAPFGSLYLIMGLLLKMGVFPFHFWFPSVMAGLSWISCLLLTTWQKVAPIFLIMCLIDAKLVYTVFILLCVLGAGSSLMGGLGGMNQTQIRALLAYSSIGHMGWIIYAACYSESGMKVYFSIYVVITICVFLSLWALDLGSLSNLGSLNKKNSNGAFSFMVMLLSLGGLPPFLGFISKWVVVNLAMSTDSWGFLFILIIGSLLSLFYYLNLFFSEVLSLKISFVSAFNLSAQSMGWCVNPLLIVNLLGGVPLIFYLLVGFF